MHCNVYRVRLNTKYAKHKSDFTLLNNLCLAGEANLDRPDAGEVAPNEEAL